MDFERSILIKCSAQSVFAFLRDKHLHDQTDESPVLVIQKISPGPVSVGTRYREVVHMLPWYDAEILSEVTCFKPHSFLEEDFHSTSMHGHLAYEFQAQGDSTILIQRESIHYTGFLKVLEPLIKFFLLRKIEQRLLSIKQIIEEGDPG